MKVFECQNEEELKKICAEINQLAIHKIFLLKGELGTGKTTFTKHFLKILDCQDQVTSPTFSIINEYRNANERIYHMDLYRLKDYQEAMEIGIEDYLYSGQYCFIEWPGIIQEFLPDAHHKLEFHILEDNKRKIHFT